VRRLIVNADDFGFTAGINRGIVESHTRGIVTSCTLMANGRAFDDAVRLAKSFPRLSVGCHVVLIDGEPVLDAKQLPSLTSSSAQFRDGVMSFAVAQRTHEIGLRMALGAGTKQVLRLILEEGMLLASIGLVIGLIGSYFVGRTMKSVLYQITAIDPAAFGAVAPVLLVSALLACYIPARRATQVDPMVALRDE